MRVATRIIIIAAVGVLLRSLAWGSATGLSSGTKTLATNNSSVSRCDTDGVTIGHNLSGSNVVSVTVTGIASGCATGTLSVDVDNGTSNSSGSATVPTGGGSMTVSLAASVALKDAMEEDVTIAGP